eukprot:4312800-Amphidinium_carterae.2
MDWQSLVYESSSSWTVPSQEHRKKVQLDRKKEHQDWRQTRLCWNKVHENSVIYQVLNHTTMLPYIRKMSQTDRLFKQRRCQSIVKACEGQTEEMINWLFAFQGQEDMEPSDVPPTIRENERVVGAGAYAPPPRACAAASAVGTSASSAAGIEMPDWSKGFRLSLRLKWNAQKDTMMRAIEARWNDLATRFMILKE